MGEFIHNMQTKLKTSSVGAVLFSFKLLTGLLFGLMISLIAEEIVGFGDFAFWFVIIIVTALFLRFSRGWGGWGVVIFNLVIFLMGMLLKLYITVAPGA